MNGLVSKIALAGVVAGALSLGGCATREAVEHAQMTADSALSQAQAAAAAAQRAQAAADQAGADAHAVGSRVDSMAAAEAAERDAGMARHHEHGHHHHHHHHGHHHHKMGTKGATGH